MWSQTAGSVSLATAPALAPNGQPLHRQTEHTGGPCPQQTSVCRAGTGLGRRRTRVPGNKHVCAVLVHGTMHRPTCSKLTKERDPASCTISSLLSLARKPWIEAAHTRDQHWSCHARCVCVPKMGVLALAPLTTTTLSPACPYTQTM